MSRDSNAPTNELPDLVDRKEEYEAITERLARPDDTALYVYGPKGTGKTLLIRHSIGTLPNRIPVCVLSCIQHDTQYKVLSSLCNAIADGTFTTGYHTAQLYTALKAALDDQDLVIILDDIDFLLLNDGSDLLYALSRLGQQAPQLVLLSSTHPDPATELDERTYSSLQPYTVDIEPYTEVEAVHVLEHCVTDWVDQDVTPAAVAAVAATTTNIQLAYHWFTLAAEITDGPISDAVVQLVRDDAKRRYQTALLAAFSHHHWLLLDAVNLLTAETQPVRSGTVYDWYQELCAQTGTTSLSTRRISDYLKHLELLNLIRAEYHYGGADGKTRYIWSQQRG